MKVSADNPALKYLEIESELFPERDAAQAKLFLTEIVEDVRGRVWRKDYDSRAAGQGHLSAEEKLRTVYEALHDRGYLYDPQHYLTRGLIDRRLDCDTTSLVVLAVAHEMKWPVYGVRAPQHFFVRWEEEDGQGRVVNRFNMDLGGKVYDDTFYRKDFYQGDLEIHPATITRGVHLRSLSPDDLMSDARAAVCLGRLEEGRYADAELHCDEAVRADPTNVYAYSYRMDARRGLKDTRGAVYDEFAIQRLDPYSPTPYLIRGGVNGALGRFEEALAQYSMAIGLSPNDPGPYLGTGLTLYASGNPIAAEGYFDKAVSLGWWHFSEYLLDGVSERAAGSLMPRVIEFDQKDRTRLARIHIDRGMNRLSLGRRDEAHEDFKAALLLDDSLWASLPAKARALFF